MVKKSTHQIGMQLGTEFDMRDEWIQLEKIITDRGSKYSVTAGRVRGKEDIKAFLKKLKANKKYAKATHNTYAVRISRDGQTWDIKNDDGETGAGMVILRILQKQDITNIIVVVTRWYGGIMLHGDRFAHVQNATKLIIQNIKKDK